MGITLGTLGDLRAGAFEGKSLKEAWFEGTKLWPTTGINTILKLKPTVYLPLGGDIDDYSGNNNNPVSTVGNIGYYTAGFNGAPCLDLIDGGTALRLPEVVKGTDSFTISVCAFNMGSSNTSYNGITGGVIAGNISSGLGYALATQTPGRPDSVPMQFQVYNGGGNQLCRSNINSWITNGWNHIILIFDWPSRDIRLYVNGKGVGIIAPDEYPLNGPVSYSGQGQGWDGHIWLGRCFQTTSPPLDWWQGYLQEYAYFSHAFTSAELNLVLRVYKGNMLPNTSKSPSIDSWGSTKPFVCTGGTGTTENDIKPNMIEASTTNKVTVTDDVKGFYFSRSMSPDIGVEPTISGYLFRAEWTVAGITFPLNLMDHLKNIENNLDGSGAYLRVNYGIFPPNVDITFRFMFQGVTQTFIMTKVQ